MNNYTLVDIATKLKDELDEKQEKGNYVKSINGIVPNTDGNVSIQASSGIHVGTEEPTDSDIDLWIDTDEESEGGVLTTSGGTLTGTTVIYPEDEYNPATIGTVFSADNGGAIAFTSSDGDDVVNIESGNGAFLMIDHLEDGYHQAMMMTRDETIGASAFGCVGDTAISFSENGEGYARLMMSGCHYQISSESDAGETIFTIRGGFVPYTNKGFLVTKVNGVAADANGEVTIPVGGSGGSVDGALLSTGGVFNGTTTITTNADDGSVDEVGSQYLIESGKALVISNVPYNDLGNDENAVSLYISSKNAVASLMSSTDTSTGGIATIEGGVVCQSQLNTDENGIVAGIIGCDASQCGFEAIEIGDAVGFSSFVVTATDGFISSSFAKIDFSAIETGEVKTHIIDSSTPDTYFVLGGILKFADIQDPYFTSDDANVGTFLSWYKVIEFSLIDSIELGEGWRFAGEIPEDIELGGGVLAMTLPGEGIIIPLNF